MMKYLMTITLFALVSVGCVNQKLRTDAIVQDIDTASSKTPVRAINAAVQANQEIHFIGSNDLIITLTTTDNFETAQLRDNSDVIYELKRTISGSGIRLVNDVGVFIHFKNFNGTNEGTVEFVKDQPIEIKEFKQ